jgi:hypothetical protein
MSKTVALSIDEAICNEVRKGDVTSVNAWGDLVEEQGSPDDAEVIRSMIKLAGSFEEEGDRRPSWLMFESDGGLTVQRYACHNLHSSKELRR